MISSPGWPDAHAQVGGYGDGGGSGSNEGGRIGGTEIVDRQALRLTCAVNYLTEGATHARAGLAGSRQFAISLMRGAYN